MNWCLPKHLVTKMKGEIDEGKINNLIEMSSRERRKFFAKYVGEENAKEINSLFESKLLVKNQKKGLEKFVKKATGMTPETKKDMLSKVNRMTKVLQPEDVNKFMADLAEHKLGVGVTIEEAKQLVDMAKVVNDKKEAVTDWTNREYESPAMEYGRAQIDFDDYVNHLKQSAKAVTWERFKASPLKSTGRLVGMIPGQTKAIKASMDNSAIFNQGWKVLTTHPKIWANNSKATFGVMWKTLGGQNVERELHADIRSRPRSIDGTYRRMGLDVYGVTEESFPTSAPSRIPGLGRLYKASEAAFTYFAQKNRVDLADLYLDLAEKAGVDLTNKKELESIGKLVNSLTSRGHLGKLEPVATTINNVFFSPRNWKANIDFITAHQFQKQVSPFVRKQAAMNMIKMIVFTAIVLAVAKAADDDAVDWDPRSANFGNIKVGNSRFNVSGGFGSIVTLASRFLSWSTKSSTTGNITPLNTGKWGGMTVGDVVGNYSENKLSPIASVFKEIFLTNEDFEGNKPTFGGEAYNLLMPLGIASDIEAYHDPQAADMLAVAIADFLGIAVNTYSKK